MSEHKFIKLRDGVEIYANFKNVGSSVWVIALHGIGEHQGRHVYLEHILGSDFNLFRYDFRGHGRSTGKRGYVDNFYQYMQDLDEIIDFLKRQHRMKEFILFGHSMGGLIVSGYLQSFAKKQFYPKKVIIHAPPVGIGGTLGIFLNKVPQNIFYMITKIPISIPLKKMFNLGLLSHEPTVKQDYIADTLNCTQLHSKLLAELIYTMREVFSKPLDPLCPLYCSIGDKDKIVNVENFLDYFRVVETKASVKILNGAYHEVHHEIDLYRVAYFAYLKDIFDKK